MVRKLLVVYLLFKSIIPFAQQPDGREMRGAWITTVKNVDYPSSKYLTVEEQKKEFVEIVDLYKKIGINAVFVQVRPAADAFYESKYEPWSEWLTGEQGLAPKPLYDPLKFMIKECKERDIEFHAWVNPFRAVANTENADISKNHISNRNPEWFFTYGKNKYFNPGIPEVRQWIISIIVDIVSRYDIDGIHFDDYFYPYPEKNENNKIIAIPDFFTFKKYNKTFNNIADWRRNNMDVFIHKVNDTIKSIKPYLKFGVAPSGVWRNKKIDTKGSNTVGLAHYDYLYADVVKWLKNGWIDYVAPQLYWNIGNKYADYMELTNWWSKHLYGRHLYIGQAPYRASKDATQKAWQNANELPNQMRVNRKNPKILGSIFYKTSAFKRNPLGFNDSLQYNFYANHVATPKMDWLTEITTDTVSTDTTTVTDTVIIADKTPPPPVENFTYTKIGRQYMLSWDKHDVSGKAPNDSAVKFIIYKYRRFDAKLVDEENIISETKQNYVFIKRPWFGFLRRKYSLVVRAVDKAGNKSKVSNSIELRLRK